MADYPPPPWRLRGDLWISVWILRGEGLVAMIWADYQPGGDLVYHELVNVRLLWRRGLALTIPAIWVDNAHALEGGRELWDIPKEFATFPRGILEATGIASATYTRGLFFAGRWPIFIRVCQPGADTHLRADGRVAFCRAVWHIPSEGSLAKLSNRRPLFSFRVVDARIRFGD